MKYLFIFLLIVKFGFAMPIEGLSWKMTKEEVKKTFPAMTIETSYKNEEVFKVDKIINSDTLTLSFLFYKDSLIQVKVSNKYPRQSRSFSRKFLKKVEEEYTFTDIKTDYIKSSESIKQTKEYQGTSKDDRSHLILKIDITDNKYKNTFIFSDSDYLKE